MQWGVVCVYVYKVYAEEEVVTHVGAALCAMTCAGFETGDDSIKCAAKDFADRLLRSPSPPIPTKLLTKLTEHKCPTQPAPLIKGNTYSCTHASAIPLNYYKADCT